VFGGDQRQPAVGLAQDAGGIRRAGATLPDTEPVCGGSACTSGSDRQPPGETQPDAVTPRAALWELLAGMRVVAAVGTGSVLGAETGAGTGRGQLGTGAAVVGGEPADRSGQRVPAAPPVVRSERDGCVAGSGFRGGGKGSAVSLPG